MVVPGLFPRVPLKATGKGVGNLVRADLCLDFVKRTKFPKPFYQNRFARQMNNTKVKITVVTASTIRVESLYNALVVLQFSCNNWLETTNRSPRIFDESSLF